MAPTPVGPADPTLPAGARPLRAGLVLADGEQEVLAYLCEQRPELVDPFLAKLPTARRAILQRLLQAAVREGLATAGEAASPAQLMLHAETGGTLQVPLARRLSLARFDLAGEVTDGDGKALDHPVTVFERLAAPGDEPVSRQRWAHFRAELANSTANLALALAGMSLRQRRLQPMAGARDLATTLAWVEHCRRRDPTFSPLAFFEQLVVEGHPLHPGAKLRFGMAVADVLRHSPEFEAQPEVVPVAVARHACRQASLDGASVSDLLFADHPPLQEACARELRERGLSLADYEIVPLHPWQARHTLSARYQAALARQEIVPIRRVTLPTRALMSLRGLAPIAADGRPRHHLKTAVDVQITGAVRTVSPQAVDNGPMLSRLLREVADREQGFGGRLVVLEERAGIAYEPADPHLTADERFELAKNLAALVRENPETHVAPGEMALPGAALLASSPFADRPVAAEFVEAFAASRGMPCDDAAVVAFLAHYARTCIEGFLVLMTRYGISLEGHLQNAIAVFRDGALVRMLVRDFGGVRVLPERLEPHGLQAPLAAGSATLARDVADLRNKLAFPLIQNHVGELIACLVRHFGLSEARLWQPVAGALRAAYARLKADPAIALRAAEDEAAMTGATLALKAMVTMRLKGDVTRYTFARVPNPLAPDPLLHLSEDEAAVVEYVRRQAPELAPVLPPALARARQTLLQRLLSALLREKLLAGAPVPEDRAWATESCWWQAPLAGDEALLFTVLSEHAFGRLELGGEVLYRQGATLRRLPGPAALIAVIGRRLPVGEVASWRQLAVELGNGVGNLALAYAHAAGASGTLQAQAKAAGVTRAVDWGRHAEAGIPGFDASCFFEQLAVEGHRLHPGAKTKLGMTPAEVRRFAPEFGADVPVRVVGVRRERLEWADADPAAGLNGTLFKAFPGLADRLAGAWADKGLALADSGFVPVHPWQLQHALPAIYGAELAEGILMPVEGVALPCRATASFRTLLPAAGARGLALKLAVNSLMTSTLRSISAHAAQNGPRFTRLIREVMAREPGLSDFVPVCELAGYSFRTDPAATDPALLQAKSRNLSAVLRERADTRARPGELAIVGCALYAESPVSGKPVLVELVECYAAARGTAVSPELAADFLTAYACRLVPGVLTLMAAYGIGLEAHLQNCVPVFRDGEPVRMLVRDWGGVRLYGPRLSLQGLAAGFRDGSVTVTDRLSELHNKVYYTLMQNHLAEIVLTLDRHCRLAEARAWTLVRAVCDATFADLARDPLLLEAAAADWAALTAPMVDYKALTRMRLSPEAPGYRYVPVPNPLGQEAVDPS